MQPALMHPFFLLDLDPATKWGIIALAVITMVYAALRPLFRKKDPLSRPPNFSSLSQQRSVERQMQNMLVELAEMSRQITAQLDTRAAKLETLIREADQKIAALGSQPGATALSAGAAPPPPAAPVQAESTGAQPPMVDPRHALIYALADQGRSCPDIARELNQPSGEIELILKLRR